jgi:hypothetical protein
VKFGQLADPDGNSVTFVEPLPPHDSAEALQATARQFPGGEAEVQVFESYRSDGMIVLVAIERQHGEVGGLPDQDWSLRVTLVFRRDGSQWRFDLGTAGRHGPW